MTCDCPSAPGADHEVVLRVGTLLLGPSTTQHHTVFSFFNVFVDGQWASTGHAKKEWSGYRIAIVAWLSVCTVQFLPRRATGAVIWEKAGGRRKAIECYESLEGARVRSACVPPHRFVVLTSMREEAYDMRLEWNI